MKYDIESLTEGYAALYLSIVKGVPPDTAFDMLSNPFRQRRKWCEDDIREIQECRKEGYTWAQIGKMYETSPGNLFRMVKYYNEMKGV